MQPHSRVSTWIRELLAQVEANGPEAEVHLIMVVEIVENDRDAETAHLVLHTVWMYAEHTTVSGTVDFHLYLALGEQFILYAAQRVGPGESLWAHLDLTRGTLDVIAPKRNGGFPIE